MLNYGRHVLEERRAGLAAPLWLPGASVRALAEVIAYPPGEPVPEQLLGYRKRPRYDPDDWRRRSRGHAITHLSGYGLDYCTWLLKEIIWRISRPALRRAEFISGRQGRPPGADPGLGSQVQLPGLPGQASLLKQP